MSAPYYRDDLALVHHLGFGFHADLVAPGVLAHLRPVLARHGLVVELGGVLAVDICDLEWGTHRVGAPPAGRVGDTWAIVTEYSLPSPSRFVRQMAVFLKNNDGSWRRDDERHDNVLIDTSTLPTLLARHGVDAVVRSAFGSETLPVGLRAVVGRRDASPR